MLAKLAWRSLKLPDTLWARLLRAKYGNLDDGPDVPPTVSKSLVWRSMLYGF